MDSNWAAEHLQTIRTLMERSAIYRRALAPVMLYNGVLGLAAAGLGFALKVAATGSFILFWYAVSVLALAGSFLLVRRQALKDAEPFWSPPTRRVTQAAVPPLAAGFFLGLLVWLKLNSAAQGSPTSPGMLWLPLGWVILYGCAFHAAGFFMPRGMRLFGWVFILGGCALLGADLPNRFGPLLCFHGVMGAFFGALHLAYGIYLYFTERPGNEA
jgi:hypothetical protein